ncbi:MAG: MarR family winged helix-turn-helix transcriptional regulator [Candidatus Cryptobacteroides sp.]|jgi:DNA-binding MarR family transcriptional regulator|nr:MarR family transcriptional regulator [Bacteroidota bacterium]NLN99501.1 MarR family transcriptional regulator [Bacteroidales bacterium]
MILSKQLVLFLNIVHTSMKQCMVNDFKQSGFNLTPEQFLVMDTLWDEGVLTQQQIADITLRDKNSIVKLIDGLESRKLVTRVSNPDDRRQNLIKVTDYSRSIKDKVTKVAMDSVQKIIRGLAQPDLEAFVRMLSKMELNIDPKVDLMAMATKYPTNKQ